MEGIPGKEVNHANRIRNAPPKAIGGLVAPLDDEDEQLRWLASLSLQGIGGGTVTATLRAFIDQAPWAMPRESNGRLPRAVSITSKSAWAAAGHP